MEGLIKDIISSLEQLKDEKRVKFANTSYPTKTMKILGVSNPNLKVVLKELKSLTKAYTGEEALNLIKSLCATNIFECQHLAFKYIENHKKVFSVITEKDINDLCKNMDNWVSVDNYGALVIGYAWRIGIIDINKIKSYYKSDDFWIRRIALVATVSLNQKARGGTGDAERTLEICKLAVSDHHDMINKALSWALRELAKFDKKPVAKFVEIHKENLHNRVLREVTNKLTLGTKN